MKSNVTVVIVTYNGGGGLRITLEKYEEQTIKPDTLIIVNNASKDGTYEFVEEWKMQKGAFKRFVIHSETNVGGAGGFSIGIKEAMNLDNEFIFLSDDDAVPNVDMLERINYL